MKIGIIQQTITPDVEANKAKLRAEIVAAATEGAELVVLQEFHIFVKLRILSCSTLQSQFLVHQPSSIRKWLANVESCL